MEKTFNEHNYDLSSVLDLEFKVVMDHTKMKAEGENSILGSFCLELGTYDKMKKELILPKGLQKFSVAIEVFTLMCKDNRKKTNPKWVLKLNTLMNRSTELKCFSHVELMQSAQAEKDMRQMELQKKFLDIKQQEAISNVTGQIANMDLPNTSLGNGRDNAEWHVDFVKNYIGLQK